MWGRRRTRPSRWATARRWAERVISAEAKQALDALAGNGLYQSEPVSITHCRIGGRAFSLATDMERDPVQRNFRLGRFYEGGQLGFLSERLRGGATVLDVGANAGNHTLYFATLGGAARVIPVEPNPRAYRLLILNVLMNGLSDRVDLRHLGVGLSDRQRGGYAMEDRWRNLGAARMLEDQGDIEVHRGDELFAGLRPDLIKVDVEGMEIEVLEGLTGIIADARPMLFVEVRHEADAQFTDFAARHGYRELQRWGEKLTNRLMLPA